MHDIPWDYNGMLPSSENRCHPPELRLLITHGSIPLGHAGSTSLHLWVAVAGAAPPAAPAPYGFLSHSLRLPVSLPTAPCLTAHGSCSSRLRHLSFQVVPHAHFRIFACTACSWPVGHMVHKFGELNAPWARQPNP